MKDYDTYKIIKNRIGKLENELSAYEDELLHIIDKIDDINNIEVIETYLERNEQKYSDFVKEYESLTEETEDKLFIIKNNLNDKERLIRNKTNYILRTLLDKIENIAKYSTIFKKRKTIIQVEQLNKDIQKQFDLIKTLKKEVKETHDSYLSKTISIMGILISMFTIVVPNIGLFSSKNNITIGNVLLINGSILMSIGILMYIIFFLKDDINKNFKRYFTYSLLVIVAGLLYEFGLNFSFDINFTDVFFDNIINVSK